MSNQSEITAFLASKGLSPNQIAGVEGNLYVESGFNPTLPNRAEGAIGIAQWEGGRRVALDNYAARTGGSETSLQTQLGYLWSELQGGEHASLTALQATTTPAAAAAVWDADYERSSGAARKQRIAAANRIAAGGTLGGSSSSSSSASSAGSSSAGGSSSVNPAGLLGGGASAVAGLLSNPVGSIADAAVGPLAGALAPLFYKSLAILVAGGLVTLGVYRLAAPTIHRGTAATSQAAGTVAKLAAL